MKQLESKKLKYIAGLAKNRKVICQQQHEGGKVEIRLDELAKSLNPDAFAAIQLELVMTKTVWLATVEVEISGESETRIIAIFMNAPSLEEATELN